METNQPSQTSVDPRKFEQNLDFLRFVQEEIIKDPHLMNANGGSTAYLNPNPTSQYDPRCSINDSGLNIFRMLAKFNVQHNYFDYVLPLQAKGKRARPEGKEDHWLVAALIVEAEDASSREATEFIESRPAYDDETSPLKLEDRLIELAEHYDGAILVDSKEIFPYIKYSAADREARMNFNYRYGHDVRYYSDIEQKKLLPSTFTNAAGGKPQTGTRTSAFTSTARVLVDNSKSNVMKTTTFGRTGVGKVLTMYTDSKKDKVYIYEFFLYSENDISRLMHKPENQVAQDFYFNPDDRIVGIVRHYQTNLNPDVRHQLNQVLRSIANGTSLSISLRARLLDTVSDFDHRLKRNTPLETVLETCDISPYLKDGLRWALFGKTPSKHLTNTVNQLFKDGERNLKPAYSLPPELRQIRDCYEQMLKGAMIEPRLEFARYISPAEIGVSKEFINSKMAEYRGSFGHLPPDL